MKKSVTVAESSAAEAMRTLTAQWYNAVVSGCDLDPRTFQLAQGYQRVGSTSEALWNIFDAIPPMSLSHFWNPAQVDNFSSVYGGVINNLIPQNSGRFQAAMGDYYSKWVDYLHTTPPPVIPSGGIRALFDTWQQLNMPPEQGQNAYTEYQEVSQGVVPVAVQMWLDAGGGTGGVKAYNATVEDLTAQITPATPGKNVSMDSATESSETTHTWASGEVGGWYDFFAGEGSGSWDELTTKTTQAGVEIEAKFSHLTTFSTGPLARPSSNPVLKDYKPWYDGEALNLAYHHDNNFVWSQTPPSWQDTFGPDGNLRHLTTSLVVVDGVEVTITSAASFTESEQESVKASAAFGFFPFFEAEASGGWTHKFSFNDSGGMTVTSSVPEGVSIVLGAIVTSIADILG